VDPGLLPGRGAPPLEFDVPSAGAGGGGGVAGRVVITVHNLSLSGLDTANLLEGPAAVEATALHLGLGAEWVNITGSVTLNITTTPGGAGGGAGAGVAAPPLVERVRLEAGAYTRPLLSST